MAYQTPKTDWANGDIPTAEDFNRIEGNTQTGANALVEIWSGSATAGQTITLILGWYLCDCKVWARQ